MVGQAFARRRIEPERCRDAAIGGCRDGFEKGPRRDRRRQRPEPRFAIELAQPFRRRRHGALRPERPMETQAVPARLTARHMVAALLHEAGEGGIGEGVIGLAQIARDTADRAADGEEAKRVGARQCVEMHRAVIFRREHIQRIGGILGKDQPVPQDPGAMDHAADRTETRPCGPAGGGAGLRIGEIGDQADDLDPLFAPGGDRACALAFRRATREQGETPRSRLDQRPDQMQRDRAMAAADENGAGGFRHDDPGRATIAGARQTQALLHHPVREGGVVHQEIETPVMGGQDMRPDLAAPGEDATADARHLAGEAAQETRQAMRDHRIGAEHQQPQLLRLSGEHPAEIERFGQRGPRLAGGDLPDQPLHRRRIVAYGQIRERRIRVAAIPSAQIGRASRQGEGAPFDLEIVAAAGILRLGRALAFAREIGGGLRRRSGQGQAALAEMCGEGGDAAIFIAERGVERVAERFFEAGGEGEKRSGVEAEIKERRVRIGDLRQPGRGADMAGDEGAPRVTARLRAGGCCCGRGRCGRDRLRRFNRCFDRFCRGAQSGDALLFQPAGEGIGARIFIEQRRIDLRVDLRVEARREIQEIRGGEAEIEETRRGIVDPGAGTVGDDEGDEFLAQIRHARGGDGRSRRRRCRSGRCEVLRSADPFGAERFDHAKAVSSLVEEPQVVMQDVVVALRRLRQAADDTGIAEAGAACPQTPDRQRNGGVAVAEAEPAGGEGDHRRAIHQCGMQCMGLRRIARGVGQSDIGDDDVVPQIGGALSGHPGSVADRERPCAGIDLGQLARDHRSQRRQFRGSRRGRRGVFGEAAAAMYPGAVLARNREAARRCIIGERDLRHRIGRDAQGVREDDVLQNERITAEAVFTEGLPDQIEPGHAGHQRLIMHVMIAQDRMGAREGGFEPEIGNGVEGHDRLVPVQAVRMSLKPPAAGRGAGGAGRSRGWSCGWSCGGAGPVAPSSGRGCQHQGPSRAGTGSASRAGA